MDEKQAHEHGQAIVVGKEMAALALALDLLDHAVQKTARGVVDDAEGLGVVGVEHVVLQEEAFARMLVLQKLLAELQHVALLGVLGVEGVHLAWRDEEERVVGHLVAVEIDIVVALPPQKPYNGVEGVRVQMYRAKALLLEHLGHAAQAKHALLPRGGSL